MDTQTISSMYMNMNNKNNERYKELRERSKCKHKDMFRSSSHCSTFPPSHRRISLYPRRTFHKRTSTEELQLNAESTQLLLSYTILYTRGAQSKERNTTWWSKEKSNNFLTKKILRINLELDSSSMWEIIVFRKKM